MLCEKYYLAAPELKIEEFNSRLFFFFCLHSPFPFQMWTFSLCNLGCGCSEITQPHVAVLAQWSWCCWVSLTPNVHVCQWSPPESPSRPCTYLLIFSTCCLSFSRWEKLFNVFTSASWASGGGVSMYAGGDVCEITDRMEHPPTCLIKNVYSSDISMNASGKMKKKNLLSEMSGLNISSVIWPLY